MIVVVIPDAGPLISLARADRLDLLDRFNSQILITDAVKIEILGGRLRTADQDLLRDWLQSGGNRVRVVETPWGAAMLENFRLREALSAEKRVRIPRNPLLRNSGEKSIRDLAEEIRHGMSSEETGLVLFEDQHVPKIDFGPYMRVMSTWSFAGALETLEIIPSAADLFDRIELAGRRSPRADYDWIPRDVPDDLAASYDLGTIQTFEPREQGQHLTLTDAIKSGETDRLRQLIDDGADVNALNDKGWTPLHIAAHRGTPDLVQTLLAAQANPHSPGPDKTTPLHWAVRRKAPVVASTLVMMLLAAGTDPAVRDDQGRTALMIGMTNPALAGTDGLTRLRAVSPPPPADPKPEDSGSSFTP